MLAVLLLGLKNLFKYKDISVFMSSHQKGGGHIIFGADPIGVCIVITMTLSCLCNNL